MFGIYFPANNAAYSALFIFETIGLVVGAIISIFFCVRVKVYIFMGLIVIGIITYSLLEGKSNKNSLDNTKKVNKEVDLNDGDNTVKTEF